MTMGSDPMDERVNLIAQAFHEAYERLAPGYGYKTREASAVPWKDVPEQNKRLMIDVVDELLTERVILVGRIAEITEQPGYPQGPGESLSALDMLSPGERAEAHEAILKGRALAQTFDRDMEKLREQTGPCSKAQIPADAVEAAYELLPREPDREDVEAAIRAALDKLGLKKEYRGRGRYPRPDISEARWASNWRSVE